VKLQFVFFWVGAPCSVVAGYQCFGGLHAFSWRGAR